MLRWARRLTVLPALALAACAIASGPGNADARSLPFYAIDGQTVALPHGVQPWLPSWAPDGRHILFENQANGTLWDVAGDTGPAHCITCRFRDAPKIVGGFHDVFPDERRVFLSHGLGASGGVDSGPDADAWVLTCTPSVWRCRRHSYLPVDMSQDKIGGGFIVQRRTWHLAPDGVHLAWTEIRLGASLMIVGRLHRESDRYVVEDQRVVNPTGPASLTADDPAGWANAGQLYELKSFADGGRDVLAVSERGGDPNVLAINLATGHVRQLTGNLAWDEDGALSPDGSLYALQSARERPGVQALGWIPQLQPFFDYPLAAAFAVNGDEWKDYQCDLSSWLLPGTGDDGGKLVGQPLETFATHGPLTSGDQLIGQQMWDPQSNAVVLQETRRTHPPAGANPQVAQLGLTPNRLFIAHIPRPATRPQRVVASDVGTWAPVPQDYQATLGATTDVVLHGRGGGTATLDLSGSIAGGQWTVTYAHYSADGHTFLDGSETVSGSPQATLTIDADVQVSGAHTGSLHADLVLDSATTPHTMTGYYTARYDGRTAPPIAQPGPCYAHLPHTARLRVTARRDGSHVMVRVSADIDGEVRPVAGARVAAGTQSVMTYRDGRAVLAGKASRRIRVSAGTTFAPLSLRGVG